VQSVRFAPAFLLLFLFACSSDAASVPREDGGSPSDGSAPSDASPPYGAPYTGGQYNLGPVDYDETQFHNACAPTTKYAPLIRQEEGTLLAGLWNGIPNVAGYCDACIFVATAKGKSALLRVVTYGATSANSIDVSPDAWAILNSGEYPRTMTWQFAECAGTGPIAYEFQTGSSEYWTSLWVRSARVPLAKVEVTSAHHTTPIALTRGTDGTLTDASGFGKGSFSITLTGIDGHVVTDSFAWPSAGIAGQTLMGHGNFP
jgi:expansin (peptidoglycan-binding protein)